jgi:hypothetical protein
MSDDKPIICPNCGAAATEFDKFCAKCGAHLGHIGKDPSKIHVEKEQPSYGKSEFTFEEFEEQQKRQYQQDSSSRQFGRQQYGQQKQQYGQQQYGQQQYGTGLYDSDYLEQMQKIQRMVQIATITSLLGICFSFIAPIALILNIYYIIRFKQMGIQLRPLLQPLIYSIFATVLLGVNIFFIVTQM